MTDAVELMDGVAIGSRWNLILALWRNPPSLSVTQVECEDERVKQKTSWFRRANPLVNRRRSLSRRPARDGVESCKERINESVHAQGGWK